MPRGKLPVTAPGVASRGFFLPWPMEPGMRGVCPSKERVAQLIERGVYEG